MLFMFLTASGDPAAEASPAFDLAALERRTNRLSVHAQKSCGLLGGEHFRQLVTRERRTSSRHR
jgi:hypothetical protein